jgi:hypothetical protein
LLPGVLLGGPAGGTAGPLLAGPAGGVTGPLLGGLDDGAMLAPTGGSGPWDLVGLVELVVGPEGLPVAGSTVGADVPKISTISQLGQLVSLSS